MTQTAEAKTFSPEVTEILDKIEKWNLLQLKEFKEAYEHRFGVTAAPAAMVIPGMMGGAAAAPAAEEKTLFKVMLTDIGPNKIQVIKVIRQITNLGLKEAKDLVEGTPQKVKEDVSKEEADKIKAELEKSGAKVEIK